MIFLKSTLYGALGRPITFGLNPNTTYNLTGNNETDTAINSLIDNAGDVVVDIIANNAGNSTIFNWIALKT